jgi:CBS domain-containing protein
MMSSISVKDAFSEKFSTVYESDALSKCLDLFKKEMPPVLAVLDEKGKYAGVIARRWIIRSRLDPATTKVKTLMRPAPKVNPEVILSKAAKLMIESGVRQLPVFEGKNSWDLSRMKTSYMAP